MHEVIVRLQNSVHFSVKAIILDDTAHGGKVPQAAYLRLGVDMDIESVGVGGGGVL